MTPSLYAHLERAMLALSERELDRFGRRMFLLARESEPGPIADLVAALALVVVESAEARGRMLEQLDPEHDEIGELVTDAAELAALEAMATQAEDRVLAAELADLEHEAKGPT